MMRKLLCATGVAAVALATFGAGSAQAETAPGCSSTVQIGATAYGQYQGQNAISVKQFKGCGKNWSYVFVWQSFRDKHIQYSLSAFVNAQYDDAELVQGEVDKSGSPVELWSTGTDTLTVCTQAAGMMAFGNENVVQAQTGWRC
ncbi:hypothetical protein [Kutzneria buriramensis]|uniref:Secreted protein n=1 Tax=Kutzneria buriramensis TaxID=1045776 RepID=A0A3E0I5Q3_9PSEU|nr:hypothetical protein [Kutzneria buriramensis]REH54049.1 hypothetical protein BCF44_102281 [Kutzneria buriramensis]